MKLGKDLCTHRPSFFFKKKRSRNMVALIEIGAKIKDNIKLLCKAVNFKMYFKSTPLE